MHDSNQTKTSLAVGYDVFKEYWYIYIAYIVFSVTYVIETYISKYLGKLVGEESKRRSSFKRIIQILIFSLFSRGILYIMDGNFLPFLEKVIRLNIMERDLNNDTDVGVSLKDAMTIPEQVVNFFEIIRFTLIPSFLAEFSTIYLLYKISPHIAFISLSVFIVVIIFCVINIWGLNKFFATYEINAGDDISRNHADVIRNRKNVVHYNQHRNELEHNNQLNIKYNSYYKGRYLFNYGGKITIIGLSYLALLIGIFIAFKQLKQNRLKISDITTIALLLIRFVELNGRYLISIGQFAYLIKYLNMKRCYKKISFNFNGYRDTQQVQKYNTTNTNFSMIIFNDVLIFRDTFRLRIHNLVLNKRLTVISGLSGSGKTTLISCLLRSVTHYEGSITMFGTELNNFSFKEVNSLIAYLPQHPILFNRTIFENIIYNDTSISREHVIQLIKDLKVKNITEDILDRLVTPQNNNVSGGQMQIICMMRAILRNKQLIIMDEPTSALDPLNTKYVIELLLEIRKYTNLIVVSHDDRVIKIADHNVILENGRLLAERKSS